MLDLEIKRKKIIMKFKRRQCFRDLFKKNLWFSRTIFLDVSFIICEQNYGKNEQDLQL